MTHRGPFQSLPFYDSGIHSTEETALRRCFNDKPLHSVSDDVMRKMCQTGGHGGCYLNKNSKTGKCPSSHTFTTVPMTRKKYAIQARTGERTG